VDKSLQEAAALEQRVKNIVLSLPDNTFLKHYVIYGSHLTDCNAVYHIAAGLSILAQTVHDDLHTRLGSKLHGNIYTLAIGPSTQSRKTASVQIARELIDEALPGQAAKGPGSYEGLVDSLVAKSRQLLLYEEFGSLLAQAERSYLTPIKSTLTGIYDGTPVGRELAKGRRKDVQVAQKPRLSIFGACTSGYLSRHSEPVDWTDGFFARFLVFRADRARRNDFPSRDIPEIRAWLVNALRERNGCSSAPEWFGIDNSASGIWRSWSERLDTLQIRAPKEVAGAVGRAQGHTLKIALLLAWDMGHSRQGAPWSFTAEHLEPAIEIVKIHLESVFILGEELAGTTAMNDRMSVLQAIKETPTMLGQICRGSRLLKRRVLEVMETLREEKVIEVVQVQDGTNIIEAYRRPSERNSSADVIPIGKAFKVIDPPLQTPPLSNPLADGDDGSGSDSSN
jgi:hypothetical protein